LRTDEIQTELWFDDELPLPGRSSPGIGSL
jgi:hypothetical protein